MDIELEHSQLPYLVTFSQAAELSNFSAAARALGLSQAAVSQRVQTLEKMLGKSLFQRKGGGVVLTDDGKTLYEYSQQILNLHREAHRVITGRSSLPASELTLAASSVPGEHLLPALLAGFRQQHPQVRVRATVTDSSAVLSQVERGDANLGFAGSRDKRPHLEFQHLASDRMVLIVPPGHALSRRKSVSVKHLCDQPIILRETGSGLRACFERALEQAGRSLDELSVALELGSNEGIKDAVMRGVGVAVLSTYVVEKELQAGTLSALTVNGLRCDRDMFVVRDQRRVLPIPARLFLAYLQQHPVPTLSP